MSPLKPEGPWTTTQILPEVDEWADANQPRMSPDEMREALRRLNGDDDGTPGIADLVGHIPAEVMAGIKVTIVRRDGAAMFWLRLLRSIDNEAKA